MNDNLETNLKNRENMKAAIKEEIIGPVKDFHYGSEVTSDTQSVDNDQFLYHVYGGENEEIITSTKPSKKYAAGLLYPQEKEIAQSIEESDIDITADTTDTEEDNQVEEKEEERTKNTRNLKKQSTMGFTFAVPDEASELMIDFKGGQYKSYTSATNLYNQHIQTKNSGYIDPWWVRKSIQSTLTVDLNRESKLDETNLKVFDLENKEVDTYNLSLYSYIRKVRLKEKNKSLKIVTVTLSNKTFPGNEEEKIVFQAELTASLKQQNFAKYPDASDMQADIPPEDKKFELLYLKERNYAFGHDCSTDWKEENSKVRKIKTTFLPEYEIKTMTPDIEINGEILEIHHAKLAGAKNFVEIHNILNPLLNGYKNWYDKLYEQVVPDYYKEVKRENLEDIHIAITRIEKGLNLLKREEILKIFQLTNLAMLMQMNNGKVVRRFLHNKETKKLSVENGPAFFDNLDFNDFSKLRESINNEFDNGENPSIFRNSKWRGFQIAFLLQSLESIVDKQSEERDIVDLIWFPTGGGKTEAYLGVSAFSMFYRRYLDPEDTGVDVIMRYTLRLLTADQFQRSSRLICSMDYIRSHFTSLLGTNEISIGLWVGTSTTPNTISSAGKTLQSSEKEGRNKFVIESCPWCGAEMSIVKVNNGKHYLGYHYNKKKFKTYCPNKNCHFKHHLPIYFIDEQIYDNPPTFLIGTIDKFVQLTWKPEARSLFGINVNGDRESSPPNLIIQDELHLISGPLGSLAGMYEVVIEELCSDKRENKTSKPKILSATATIKASEKQIKSVFGKKESKLFPPSGLDINDNFFSTVLYDKDTGSPAPGRKYVGVYTTTQGKLQTQVQTISSLITQTNELSEEDKDPFFTLLSFYNSINDIGKARILLEQDIKNNISTYYKNRNITKGRKIRDGYVKELTSRLDSGDVSKFISDLKTRYTPKANKAIDVCLASNIIEVGVDIDRLSLMMINGQPKSTSQYIQVSGRIGRKTNERPGLVVTIYNPQNSSDKSHFEHFNEYHQKLYSQVEVSSVTPFSQFSINRGLPAALIAFIRQSFSLKGVGQAPYPELFEDEDNQSAVRDFYITIRDKATTIDKSELEYMDKKFNDLYNMLLGKNYDHWKYENDNNGFMAPINKNIDDIPEYVQSVIFSMRNVDSTSKLIVNKLNYESNRKDIFGNFD